jgi:hypothetical protein
MEIVSFFERKASREGISRSEEKNTEELGREPTKPLIPGGEGMGFLLVDGNQAVMPAFFVPC